MPATARRYGLIVTNTIDQRYDPTLATQAAVAYIQDLYDIFGDRLLVAAAYNRGESGLQRDLDRQFVDNYFDAILNNETARYIFRRAAMKYTYENIDRYFSVDQLDETYEYPDTNIITINGPIDNLALWASDKGYNYYQLRQLNPRIRTNQLPDGRWDIEVFSGI
jgi:membrane-bound lytic murein transglycosylase D